jgi:hypothetical protein
MAEHRSGRERSERPDRGHTRIWVCSSNAIPTPARCVMPLAGGAVLAQDLRHWMTSSARTSVEGGIVTPSALAVFKFMTPGRGSTERHLVDRVGRLEGGPHS